MTLCEWRICHSASASSHRSNTPRDVSGESDRQELMFMWAFPTLFETAAAGRRFRTAL